MWNIAKNLIGNKKDLLAEKWHSQSPGTQGRVPYLHKNLIGAQQNLSTLILPTNHWAWLLVIKQMGSNN